MVRKSTLLLFLSHALPSSTSNLIDRMCTVIFLTFSTSLDLFGRAVFHVTDDNGMKLTDESVISYMEQVN